MADTDLDRFVAAQDGVFDVAIAELRAGAKRSHWMWFIFPQIAGLGRSDTARFYALRDRAEAEAYAAHPVLGPRLMEATDEMLRWAGRRPADAIMGAIDAAKFRSSMTLFAAVAPDPDCFVAALAGFCDGMHDPLTLEILAAGT